MNTIYLQAKDIVDEYEQFFQDVKLTPQGAV